MRRMNAFRLFILVSSLSVTGCPENKVASPTPAPAPAAEAPKAPLVTKPQVADWCKEHGVPESICTRCNANLIAGFKAKNDWCKEHELPESQCVECHPDLDAKFKAMAPKVDEKK